MDATIKISVSEIRPIFQPRTSNSSRLWELAEKADALAVMVETSWQEISKEERELLTNFAYEAIEPPVGIKGRFLAFISRLYSAWIVLKGERDAFIAYAGASDRIFSAILRMTERDNIAYQQALSEAIEEVFFESENSKTMTAEEACEWIKEISDRAFREV